MNVPSRSRRRTLTALPLSLLVLLLVCGPDTLAAEFTVTSTADTTSAGCAADCTLRGALAAALASPDSSDTVVVPAGTYKFGAVDEEHPTSTGELRLTNTSAKQLTIRGAGMGATVLAAESHDRLLRISGGGPDVLEGLTLEKGFAAERGAAWEESLYGAGILQIGGELTLDHVRVTGNVNNGYGGGIDIKSGGILRLNDSEIDHNSSSVGGGGGVNAESGTVIATSSTFDHDNSNSGEGGAVQLSAHGGHSTFTNVTFADNGNDTYEGGGVYLTEASATFTNVTFTGNDGLGNNFGGADIKAEAGSQVTLANVLLDKSPPLGAGNACAGPEVGKAGAWIDSGGNLSGDSSCALPPADMGLQLGLGELGSNGGPTPTVPLLAGSPAIDFGLAGCPATDQRGDHRLGSCDSGAFEFGAPLEEPAPVTPNPGPGTGNPSGSSNGAGSGGTGSAGPTGVSATAPVSSPAAPNYGPEAIIDSRGTATFVYHCDGGTYTQACEGTIGLTGAAAAAVRYLAATHFHVKAGQLVRVHVHLPKRTLAKLHRLHHLKLTLVLTVRQGSRHVVRREPLKFGLASKHRR